MAVKKRKKNTLTLTKKEVEAKIRDFENKTNKSIENNKIGSVSQSSLVLESLKELIKKAIDNDVSYAQISRDIQEVYSFKVSAQTIRIFAQTKLGVKKGNKKPTDTETEPKETEPIKPKEKEEVTNEKEKILIAIRKELTSFPLDSIKKAEDIEAFIRDAIENHSESEELVSGPSSM